MLNATFVLLFVRFLSAFIVCVYIGGQQNQYAEFLAGLYEAQISRHKSDMCTTVCIHDVTLFRCIDAFN